MAAEPEISPKYSCIGCVITLTSCLALWWAAHSLAPKPGVNTAPSAQIYGAPIQPRAEQPHRDVNAPQQTIALPLATGKRKAASKAAAWPPGTPVSVRLAACKAAAERFQWSFQVRNNTGTPWQGRMRIFLIGTSSESWSVEFEPDKPIEPGGAAEVPSFETGAAPKAMGGTVTRYGWAVIPTSGP